MDGIRKYISATLVAVAAISASAVSAGAQTVSEASAKAIAESFAKSKMGGAGSVSLAENVGGGSVYVFNVGEKGFVIVSGDSRAESVLGYSTNGKYVSGKTPSQMPTWLQGYSSEVRLARRLPASSFQSGNRAGETYAAVSPLITSTWNQNAPYNADCPDGSLTGCVAVAMGQVMRYSLCPNGNMSSGVAAYTDDNGVSYSKLAKTSFAWAQMLDAYTSASEVGADEVARLLHYCANSVQSTYGASSTGSSVSYVSNALVRYFGYDSDVRMVWREDYTDSEWIKLIYTELAAGRPVIYRGASSVGGHTFVCDGYDGGKFHINWGWGGAGDGYYSLSVLKPSSGGDGTEGTGYNSGQAAIIGIQAEDGVVTFVKTLESAGLTGTVDSNGKLTVTCTYNNNCGSRGNFELGVGAIDASGNLVQVVEDFGEFTLEYGGGIVYEQELYGVLPAGTYTLALIGRMDSETEFKVLDNWKTNSITAVSDGTKYTSSEALTPATGLEINATNFPDDALRNYVKSNFDLDSDGYLSDDEIAAADMLFVDGVADMTGVGYLTELTDVMVSNGTFTTADFSKNTKLIFLSLDNNANLSSLDVSKCETLVSLYLENVSNGALSLDLHSNSALEDVTIVSSDISGLNVSGLTSLLNLYVDSTPLSSIDLSTVTSLTSLTLSGAEMAGLTVTGLSNLVNLEELTLSEIGLSTVDLSTLTNLSALYLPNNSLTCLDLTANSSLTMGNITPQSVASPVDGTVLNGKICILVPGWEGKTIDPSSLSNVKVVGGNSLTPNVVVSGGDSYLVLSDDPTDASSLEGKTVTYVYITGNSSTSVKTMNVSLVVGTIDVSDVCMGVSLTAENFPDDAFRTYLSDNVDANADACLTNAELSDNAGTIELDGVSSMKGLELLGAYVQNLKSTNGSFETIDLSQSNLKTLDLSGCVKLTSVDLSNNTDLTDINLSKTGVSSLDLTGLTSLKSLRLNNVGFKLSDVKGLPASLETLAIAGNGETEVDLSSLTALKVVDLSGNSLKELDLSANTALEELNVDVNSLSYLDLSSHSLSSLTGNEDAGSFDGVVLDGKIGLPMLTGWAVGNVSNLTVNGSSVATPTTFVNGSTTYLVISEDASEASSLEGKSVSYTYSTGNTPAKSIAVDLTVGTIAVAPCTGVEINATSFPDDEFRAYVTANVDTDNNGCLSDAEAAAVMSLSLTGVADLTGIVNFTELQSLTISNSTVADVDLSANTKLKEVELNNGTFGSVNTSGLSSLTSLKLLNSIVSSNVDLTSNTSLAEVQISNSDIQKVDLTGVASVKTLTLEYVDMSKVMADGSAVKKLIVSNCDLTELDPSKYPSLNTLDVSANHLLYLDLTGRSIANVTATGQTKSLDGKIFASYVGLPVPSSFDVYAVSNLKVDGVSLTPSSQDESGQQYLVVSDDPSKSPDLEGKTVSYEYATGNTPAASVTVILTIGTIDGTAPCSGVEVTAANFPDDKFRDFVATSADANSDGCLSDEERAAVSVIKLEDGVTSLEGIENFTEVKTLTSNNATYASVDLSSNTKLTSVSLGSSNLSSVDLSALTDLQVVIIKDGKLSSLDLSGKSDLNSVVVSGNQLTTLDLTGATSLASLDISDNSGLALSNIKGISSLSALQTLNVSDCELTTLEVTAYTGLLMLDARNNHLQTLDMTGMSVSTVNLSGQTATTDGKVVDGEVLVRVSDDIDITKVATVTADGVSVTPSVKVVDGENYLYVGDAGSDPKGLEGKDVVYEYETGNTPAAKLTVRLTVGTIDASAGSDPVCTGVEVTAANFPNATFLQYVKDNVDTDADLCLTDSEIEAVTTMTLDDKTGISDLTGLAYFTELTTLSVNNLTGLTSVDLSANAKLETLSAKNTGLANLNLTDNIALKNVNVSSSASLNKINVSNCLQLEQLDCSNTKITSVDLTNLSDLKTLNLSGLELKAIDLSSCTGLTTLAVANTQLTQLEVPSSVTSLDANGCRLMSLALSSTGVADGAASSWTQNASLAMRKLSDGRYGIKVGDGFELSNVSDLEADGNAVTGDVVAEGGASYLIVAADKEAANLLNEKKLTYSYNTGKGVMKVTIGLGFSSSAGGSGDGSFWICP